MINIRRYAGLIQNKKVNQYPDAKEKAGERDRAKLLTGIFAHQQPVGKPAYECSQQGNRNQYSKHTQIYNLVDFLCGGYAKR
jgi:hypothetical protein